MKFVNAKSRILGNKTDRTTAARYQQVVNHKLVIRSNNKIIIEKKCRIIHSFSEGKKPKGNVFKIELGHDKFKRQPQQHNMLTINKSENRVIF